MNTDKAVYFVVVGDKGGCKKTSFAAELADYLASFLKARPHLVEVDIRHEIHLQKLHPETVVLDLFGHNIPEMSGAPSPAVFEQIFPLGQAAPKRTVVDLGGGVGRMFCLWLTDGAIHTFTRHDMRFVFFVMVNEEDESTFEFAAKMRKTTDGWAETVLVKCPRSPIGLGNFSQLGDGPSITFPTMPSEIMSILRSRNLTWTKALADNKTLEVFQWGKVEERRKQLSSDLDRIQNLFV